MRENVTLLTSGEENLFGERFQQNLITRSQQSTNSEKGQLQFF